MRLFGSVGVLALLLGAPALVGGADALAQDAVPATAMISLLPVGDVVGDGQSRATLHVIAVGPDGAALVGLKLKGDATAGAVDEVSEVGGGIYAVRWTPPKTDAARTVRVSVKGRSAEHGAIDIGADVLVQPPLAGVIQATSNPPVVTLGQDSSVSLSFVVPRGPGGVPQAEDLVVRVSSGEVSTVVGFGDGRFSARYTPPKVNYPHLALLTIVDRRNPTDVRGHVVIPLQGKVDFPVQAAPGSVVLLRVAGREFGPTPVAPDGRTSVPIIVPPGIGEATLVTVSGGVSKEDKLPLGVPEVRRLQAFPLPPGVPSDSRLGIPVRVLVVQPDGSPDPSAALNLSATAGRVEAPVHVGGGVFEAVYHPPDGRVKMAATLQATVPGGTVQSDGLEVALVPSMPGRVELSAEPRAVSAAGTPIQVFLRVTGPDGQGLAERPVWLRATGGAVKGTPQDLKGGDYKAQVVSDAAAPVYLRATAPPLPAGNGLAHVLVLPGSPSLPADGVSADGVLIATVDAFGHPVPNVPVSLRVARGGGSLPASVTTDAEGLAWVVYTAGASAGVAELRAIAGGHEGAAAILQGVGWMARLPVSGSAGDLAVATAWSGVQASLRIDGPQAGVAAALAPAPVAASASEPVAGAITGLVIAADPPSAPPGGTVTVRVRATDGSGRGIAGARLDLLASGGARPGPVTDLGGGEYLALVSLPPDATDKVKVSVQDADGAALSVVEITIGAAGTNPWGDAGAGWSQPPTAEPEQPSKVAKEQREPYDRPDFRLRVGAQVSSYRYLQTPSDEPGGLVDRGVGWGGDAGGAPTPIGFDVAARLIIPKVPYVGVQGQFKGAYYTFAVGEQAEGEKKPYDMLWAANVSLIGRAPIKVGREEISVGARVGFRYDDFVTYRGCLEPGCTLEYRALGMPGLDVGVELGAEFWQMYLLAAVRGGFAYGSVPYALNVDTNLGVHLTRNVFLDLGFAWQKRDVTLEGKDTGVVRGEISDAQAAGTFSVGVAF